VCEQFLSNEYGCRSNSFEHKDGKSFDFFFLLFYFFKECFFGNGLCYTQEEECSEYEQDPCIIAPQGILLLLITILIICFILGCFLYLDKDDNNECGKKMNNCKDFETREYECVDEDNGVSEGRSYYLLYIFMYMKTAYLLVVLVIHPNLSVKILVPMIKHVLIRIH
jgi:hypothetical protein